MASATTVTPFLETVSDCEAEAARYWSLPATEAVNVVEPAFRMVTRLPAIEATVGSELAKVTVPPEKAVAVRAKVESP